MVVKHSSRQLFQSLDHFFIVVPQNIDYQSVLKPRVLPRGKIIYLLHLLKNNSFKIILDV